MKVRAKFVCESVRYSKESAEVRMQPVIQGSAENKQFYRWTPGGEIVLQTINLEAARTFEPGKEYYVDFTAAE